MSYIYYRNGEEHKFESRDEYLFFKRGFGEITDEAELIAYAEKVTYGFSKHGWKQSFLGYYISDYALDPLCEALTKSEREHLVQIQQRMRAEAKAADEAREWRLVDTIYWADNSVEEIYEDKDGNRKSVMAVPPHGDTC